MEEEHATTRRRNGGGGVGAGAGAVSGHGEKRKSGEEVYGLRFTVYGWRCRAGVSLRGNGFLEILGLDFQEVTQRALRTTEGWEAGGGG